MWLFDRFKLRKATVWDSLINQVIGCTLSAFQELHIEALGNMTDEL